MENEAVLRDLQGLSKTINIVERNQLEENGDDNWQTETDATTNNVLPKSGL